jgi:hypothetical protein
MAQRIATLAGREDPGLRHRLHRPYLVLEQS